MNRPACRPSSGPAGEGGPMNRYVCPPCPPTPPCRPEDPVQLRILEALLEQNQLLSDLNGAVEGLTSAVLGSLRRP